jgi:hypothetical protein
MRINSSNSFRGAGGLACNVKVTSEVYLSVFWPTIRSFTLECGSHAPAFLSDAEIQRYIDFAVSPADPEFQSVCMAGLKRGFFDCSVKWEKAIGDAIKQMKTQQEAYSPAQQEDEPMARASPS